MTQRTDAGDGSVPDVILIADNDAGVALVLRHVLAAAGFAAVETVGDGRAAVDRIRGGGVALLIADLEMPELGGDEVIRELEHVAGAPPVLVVSAFLDARILAELGRSRLFRGAHTKPFEFAAFVRSVRGVMERAASREATGDHGVEVSR